MCVRLATALGGKGVSCFKILRWASKLQVRSEKVRNDSTLEILNPEVNMNARDAETQSVLQVKFLHDTYEFYACCRQ